MKNYKTIMAATLAALTLLLSACGGSDSAEEQQQAGLPDLESAKKVLYFYGATTKDHYAYFVESGTLENLNDDNATKLDNSQSGRLFYWADENNETNVTTDKVVMFTSSFELAGANATHEDFYYIDHYDGDERHPHPSAEFDPGNSDLNATEKEKKAAGLVKLNAYLVAQNTLKANLESNLSAIASGAALCNFYSVEEHHEEDGVEHDELFHYVLDTTGTIRKFEEHDGTIEDINQSLTVSVNGICEANKSGMSQAAEGVLVYFGGNEQKLHLVDSHGTGDMHVHSRWDIGEILGGKGAEMMVGVGALDAEVDHSDHDH